MLEFKKSTVKVDVYGKKFELRKPTVKEAQTYSKKLDASEDSALILADLLDSLGLPKATTMEMEPEHLVQLVGVLIPDKKK